MGSNRVVSLDLMRGVAIILMIVYHFFYNLNYFNFIDIKITSNPFWVGFRVVVVTLFLLAVGVSLQIVHKNGLKLNKVKKRFLILLLASLAVSIATYSVLPKYWVYFGILHFILIASLLALPFINYPRLSLILGVIIVLGYIFGFLNMHWLYSFITNYINLPKYTVDLVPFFPWFGVVLIGVGINLDIFKKADTLFIKRKNPILNSLAFFGKHSLVIYLLHEPILYGLTLLAAYI